MGTTGQIAIGARGVFAYGEERDWGQPIPPNFRVDFKTESFNNEIGNLLSEALNPSRGTSKRVPGTSNITGDVAIEQNTEGYGTWYKHALGDYVTLTAADGGIRAQVNTAYTTGGAGPHELVVTGDVTGVFETGGANYTIAVVYKDSSDDLQAVTGLAYTAAFAAGETTFTLTGGDPGVSINQGAWIIQSNATDWTGVYSHYIESGPTLPTGMTFEVGRDLAYFIYGGCKCNTLEETYTAQEILQATFSWIGRGEYSGADLLSAATSATTELDLTNYTLDYYSASQNIGYAFADDGAVFTDETTAANNNTADDVTLLPVTPAVDDAYYFGADDVFPAIEIIISTAAVTANWTITWEYWDGTAWSTLLFNNQETVDLDEAAGTYVNSFDLPSDWASTTVNAQAAYWVRARVSAYTAGTGPIGQRLYLGPGIIGFNKVGEVQVGSENEIAYDGTEVSITAGTAKLKNITNWASDSDHAAGEPVAVQGHWDDPADPPTTDPLSSFQAAVYLDGVAQEVLSGSWTLNNNLFADKFQLGDRFRAGLPEQLRTVEGVLNVEFDDEILYHKYINATSAYLEFRSVDEGEVINGAGNDVYRQKHVLFPNIEFTGTTPQIGGPDQITHDMNFTALVDQENSMNEVVVILVNTVATI